jgi:cytochrome P450
VLSGKVHLDMLRLHERYGNVVRISPREVAFFTPQAFRDIYGFRAGRQFLKDRSHYVQPVNNADHLVCAVDPAVHSRQRRLLAFAFSERALRDQEGLIRGYVDELVAALRAQCRRQRKLVRLAEDQEDDVACVDVKAWMTYATFDMTGDLMFGEPFGCMRSSELHPWIEFIFNSIKAIALAGTVGQFPWLDWLLKKFLPKKIMQQALDHFRLSAEKLDKRLEAGATERPDFVSYMLKNGMVEGNGEVADGDRMMSRAELHSNAFMCADTFSFVPFR